MRATPPCARMSAGTRSSAMTAHGARVLRDPRLVGGRDVHDHAALEHLGEARLDAERPDLHRAQSSQEASGRCAARNGSAGGAITSTRHGARLSTASAVRPNGFARVAARRGRRGRVARRGLLGERLARLAAADDAPVTSTPYESPTLSARRRSSFAAPPPRPCARRAGAPAAPRSTASAVIDGAMLGGEPARDVERLLGLGVVGERDQNRAVADRRAPRARRRAGRAWRRLKESRRRS